MRRRKWLILAAVGVSVVTASSTQAFFFVLPPLVFDPERYLRRIASVAEQARQIEELRVQIENDARLLAHTDVSTVAGLRAGLDRLRETLSTLDTLTPAAARTDFDRRHPVDWRGTPAEANRFGAVRGAWLDAERSALADARAAQNAVVADMAGASGRVERLVRASNGADGLTAALQVRTQLHAELSAELAKWQTIRDARATARGERDGAAACENAYAGAVRRWLARPGTVPPVLTGVGGYRVIGVPQATEEVTP